MTIYKGTTDTMDYKITIGFSTTKQLISRIIRWVTGSACSHAIIIFHDYALNMRMVMQAEAWGFEIRPWKRWHRENILVAEFKPSGRPLEEALLYIAAFLGAHYDYRSAIISGIKEHLSKWKQVKFSLNPNNSTKKLMCSEAVVRFLSLAGFESVQKLNPEITNPGELLRTVLEDSGAFVPVYFNRQFLFFDKKIKKGPVREHVESCETVDLQAMEQEKL